MCWGKRENDTVKPIEMVFHLSSFVLHPVPTVNFSLHDAS